MATSFGDGASTSFPAEMTVPSAGGEGATGDEEPAAVELGDSLRVAQAHEWLIVPESPTLHLKSTAMRGKWGLFVNILHVYMQHICSRVPLLCLPRTWVIAAHQHPYNHPKAY